MTSYKSDRDHDDVEFLGSELLHAAFFRFEKWRYRFRKFDGQWSSILERDLLVRGKAAAVLLFDPNLDKIVLIEQIRTGVLRRKASPWMLEIVAGIVHDDEDEADLVRREAVEEAGLAVKDLLPICHYYPSPGGCDELVSLFCGRVDASDAGGIHGLDDEDEDILVHSIPLQDAFGLLAQGALNNAPTIIAMQWLQLHLAAVRQQWGKP